MKKKEVWGIWNGVEKRFVFGIRAPSPQRALFLFRKLAPRKVTYKWRYEPKVVPNDFKNPPNALYLKEEQK